MLKDYALSLTFVGLILAAYTAIVVYHKKPGDIQRAPSAAATTSGETPGAPPAQKPATQPTSSAALTPE